MWYLYFVHAGFDTVPQPMSFSLPAGILYTPDFLLDDEVYVETKRDFKNVKDLEKAQYLACETDKTVILIDGRPTDEDGEILVFSPDGDVDLINPFPHLDNYHHPVEYPYSFRIGDILPVDFEPEILNDFNKYNGKYYPHIRIKEKTDEDLDAKRALALADLDWYEVKGSLRAMHNAIKRVENPGWYDRIEV